MFNWLRELLSAPRLSPELTAKIKAWRAEESAYLTAGDLKEQLRGQPSHRVVYMGVCGLCVYAMLCTVEQRLPELVGVCPACGQPITLHLAHVGKLVVNKEE